MGVLVESPDSPLAALDRAGYRLTGQRRAVAELIAARNGPLRKASASSRTARAFTPDVVTRLTTRP